VPEVVGATELEVVQVGALNRGLVHPTDPMSGQHGPGPSGHMVAATRAGEHQHIRVGAGRKLAADRLDHQGARGTSRMPASLLGWRLKPLPYRPAW
jgi:hypothetical protein